MGLLNVDTTTSDDRTTTITGVISCGNDKTPFGQYPITIEYNKITGSTKLLIDGKPLSEFLQIGEPMSPMQAMVWGNMDFADPPKAKYT